MSSFPGENISPTVPQPGPLVTVDLTEPRAIHILDNVRQRVAAWGDTERTLLRALDAVRAANLLVGSGPGAMGAEFRPIGRRVLRLNEISEEEAFWIIGDVRGDVLALETALAFIDEATARGRCAQIVFLGDLTAGALGDAACLAIALERFAAAPSRTIVIAGDRELALTLALANDQVTDERRPRGLADMQVAEPLRKSLRNLAREYSELVEKIPLAAICPDGMLLAHSALPRESVLANIESAQALESQANALRAFAFDRLHAREPQVIALGTGDGAPLESEDFAKSMRALHRILGVPVVRMVRGHDAVPEGHRWFRHYGEGVLLTINTMADVLPAQLGGGRRKPSMARLKSKRLRVVRFEIPESVAVIAQQIFPSVSVGPRREIFSPVVQAQSTMADSSKVFVVPAVPDAPDEFSLIIDAKVNSTQFPVEFIAANDPQAAQIHFERGVRLLSAGAWMGARQAFQEAAGSDKNALACQLNEGVASLSMGLNGHQDALRLCRGILRADAKNAWAHFNMGVSYLTSERNPIEAGRAFRLATQLLAQFADAWWALGLAFSLRGDRRSAADAFANAREYGCQLPAPSSLVGTIPARELTSLFEALRGKVVFHPTLASPPIPLSQA